ncbi:ABC transporter ATP-binding protein [Rhodobacteraceae bacterium W635]|uniref:ABC transporter ATP-binding protein n=1 Tax=Nioella halotolerans TaxID=2303578 RepID=UPI000E3D5486|nr:ABC transporter ATP-binding protein [Rhodobacteraceae bacterium W635]
MSDAVLELDAIEKGYKLGKPGEIRVLRGASIAIARGEVVALVAPSGAGKSTLLHIAGLLDSADAGTVRIGGQDLTRAKDRARTSARRQAIGFIYQFHHLLPEFSAAENVILPQLADGLPRAEAEARAADLLGRVGLENRAGHRPSELSGGEQQRVAFSRAMANKPLILLADEPTGNLDPATATVVFDTLLSLVRDTGMGALIATHNPDLAARMDRVLRMEAGQLVDRTAT